DLRHTQGARADGRKVDDPAGRLEPLERVLAGLEVELHEALSGFPVKLLFLEEIAPNVQARIVGRSGVERVFGDALVDVIMPQRDIAPFGTPELPTREPNASALELPLDVR